MKRAWGLRNSEPSGQPQDATWRVTPGAEGLSCLYGNISYFLHKSEHQETSSRLDKLKLEKRGVCATPCARHAKARVACPAVFVAMEQPLGACRLISDNRLERWRGVVDALLCVGCFLLVVPNHQVSGVFVGRREVAHRSLSHHDVNRLAQTNPHRLLRMKQPHPAPIECKGV